MKKQFSLIWLVFLFIACKKEGPFTISGVVLDSTTSKPISEATVYLLGFEGGFNIIGGSPSFFIDSVIADANGKFAFAQEKNENWGYSCMATKDLYYSGNEVTADGDFSLLATLYLNPKAWLSIHIASINTYSASDYLSISDIGVFYGNDIDTTLIDLVNGNYAELLVWGLVISGTPPIENESASIYCPAFDTTYYEIFY